MAKLTNAELQALATQLALKLNTESHEAKDAFEVKHKVKYQKFEDGVKALAFKIGLTFRSVSFDDPKAPECTYYHFAEILNRLIIKQIDIKDVKDLMLAVEKDLK